MNNLLNDVQLGMLYHTGKENAVVGIYNSQVVIKFSNSININKLQETWNYLISKFQVLRACVKDNVAITFVENLDVKINVFSQNNALKESVDDKIKELFSQTFDYYIPPLFDLSLICKDNHSYFVFTHHHILLSASSVTAICAEMFKQYDNLISDSKNEIPLNYAEYKSVFTNEDKIYWTKLLEGFSSSNQIHFHEANDTTTRSQHNNYMVSTDIASTEFKNTAENISVSKNSILLGAWAIFLNKYTGKNDIVFGTVRRNSPKLNQIGMDINTLPVRIKFQENTTISDLCKTIRAQQNELNKNPGVSLREITKNCFYRTDNSDELFSTFVDYQSISIQDILESQDINMSGRYIYFNGRSHCPLNMAAYFEHGFLQLKFDYKESVISVDLIYQIKRHYLNILTCMLDNKNIRCSDVNMFSKKEYKLILSKHNQIKQCHDHDISIPEIVKFYAKINPDKIAILEDDKKITYKELDDISSRLSSVLSNSFNVNSVIAIHTASKANHIILMLSILKASCIYLAINPSYPAATKKMYLSVSKATCIISDNEDLFEIIDNEVKVHTVDHLLNIKNADSNVSRPGHNQHAYVIFTSGSTGTPKAVLVKQKSIIDLVKDTNYIKIIESDVIVQMANVSFDASTFEIWGALLNGATSAILHKKDVLDFYALESFIKKNKISIMLCITSLFNQISQKNPELFQSLRYLIVGGETLYRKYVERVFNITSETNLKILNAYGPTENTVISTCYPINSRESLILERIPIGKPINNSMAYVLNSRKELVPTGIVGELYVSGNGLAVEYYNNLDETNKNFLQLYGDISERVYKTGDYVYRDFDDNLHFVGRIDNQVKINGYRIDLSEIKKHILSNQAVKEAELVIDKIGDKNRIVAFLVTNDKSITSDSLKIFLKDKIPSYMVPSTFIWLSKLPMNINNKLDYKKLDIVMKGKMDTKDLCIDEVNIGLLFAFEKTFGQKVKQDANFFELGGDSIDALQLVYNASRRGIELSVDDIFQYPNIKALNKIVSKKILNDQEIKKDEQKIVSGSFIPTPIQSWLLSISDLEGVQFSQICKVSIAKDVTFDAVKNAFMVLANHHDMLRLKIMKYGPTNSLTLYITEPSLSEKNTGSIRKYENIAEISTDLFNGPEISLAFSENPNLNENTNQLTIAVHHMAIDSVSWRILIEDFVSLLENNHAMTSLPNKTTSYIAWSNHLFDYAQSPTLVENEYDFYNDKKLNKSTKDFGTFQDLAYYEANIDSSIIEKLENLSKLQPFAFSDVLLLTFLMSLEEMGESTKITLESHGRNILPNIDISRTVGWFTAVFPFEFSKENGKLTFDSIYKLSSKLISAKESGHAYGLLKYLTQANKTDKTKLLDPLPGIYFNFLGELQRNNNSICSIDSIDGYVSKNIPLYFFLSVDIFKKNNACFFKISYDRNKYDHDVVKKLFSSVENNLHEFSRIFGENICYPLSPTQLGIFSYSKKNPESETYFVQAICKIDGIVNVDNLKLSCNKLIQSHDLFRAEFSLNEVEILQTIKNKCNLVFNYLLWKNLNTEQLEKRLHSYLNSDKQRLFDLSNLPLIHFSLITTDDNTHVFVISFHHIIMDGWSFYKVLEKILAYYSDPEMDDNVPQFYTAYFSSHFYNAMKAESSSFWKDTIKTDNLPTRLNFHKPISENPGYKESPHIKTTKHFSKQLTLQLQNISAVYHVTLNAIIQAIWAITLSEYSNQTAVCYGVTNSGRSDIQNLKDVIGPFISTLPMSVEIPIKAKTIDFVKSLQDNIRSLQKHEHANISVIASNLGVDPTSLFEYLFVYENYPRAALKTKDFTISDIQIAERTQYPMTVYVIEEEKISILVQHDSALFDKSDVSVFLSAFFRNLKEVVKNPEQLIQSYYMTAFPDEIETMNKQLLKSDEINIFKDISYALSINLKKINKKKAMICGEQEIFYPELDKRITELTNYLRHQYPEQTPIGILLDRSIDYVVSLLAILNANCIFVPLDPLFPADRILQIAEQAGIHVIITHSSHDTSKIKTHFIILDQIIFSNRVKLEPIQYQPDDMAYILFTSGSTGQPKGVSISRNAISGILNSVSSLLPISGDVTVLGLSSFVFDISLIDILLPLTYGGTLIIANESEQRDVEKIKILTKNYHVNFMQATPAVWQLLLDSGWVSEKDFIAISTGEALSSDLHEKLINLNCHVWNLYGPTETTIWATSLKLPSRQLDHKISTSSIGLPLQGVDCYLISSQGTPAKIGMAGELYIGGVGLSSGYVGAPNLTEEKFVTHSIANGKKLYKTGDLVRFTHHSKLEYKGRFDTQVKIHGKRIELGEIESVLRNCEEVLDAVVVVSGKSLAKKLIAFVTLKMKIAKMDFNADNIIQSIKNNLPSYMIPAGIEPIDDIPLTTAGKLNRNLLVSLANNLKSENKETIKPRNEIENSLLTIWANSLDFPKEKISVENDFFDLGGNSLSAILLAVSVEKHFSTYFPIKYVMKNTTIEAQANIIIEQKKKYKTQPIFLNHEILKDFNSPLVPIVVGQHQYSIYLIHPIGGTIFRYMNLARYLGKYYNVYGIQDPGIEAKSFLFHSLEELSAHYLKIIQNHQQKGPYIIGGASYGGNVSIEIARQLIDKSCNDVYILSCDAWALYPAMVNNNRDWFEKNVARQARDLRDMLPEDIKLPELLLDLVWQRQQLIAQYKVEKRPYKLALFKAADLTPVLEPIQDAYNHWQDFSELKLDRYIVPGNHESMLNEPNTPALFESILTYLKKCDLFNSAAEAIPKVIV